MDLHHIQKTKEEKEIQSIKKIRKIDIHRAYDGKIQGQEKRKDEKRTGRRRTCCYNFKRLTYRI